MEFISWTLLYAMALFVSMIACGEGGRRLASRRGAQASEQASHGLGVVDGAVLGLLGLIVAFTFAGALSRFDARRALVVEETNAIGTAYLRLDLVPEESQPPLRESFRQYVDARLNVYRRLPDIDAAQAALEQSKQLQTGIWVHALAAVHDSQPATMLLVPALNEMFDITATRTAALFMHPPSIVYMMLFGLAVVGAGLGGYAMTATFRDWLHLISFAAVTAFTFYVILDIEHPRIGLINLEINDQAWVTLLEGMR